MFEAASKTVLTLSRDKERLVGTPAVTMVLPTWTRDGFPKLLAGLTKLEQHLHGNG